jgi:ribosomal protein L18
MKNLRKKKREKKIKFIRAKSNNAKYELLLYRSNMNIFAHIFDIVNKRTLTTVSTKTKQVKEKFSKESKSTNKNGAEIVGKLLAEKCKEIKLPVMPFINVASYKYHGRVKSLVDAFVSNFKID